jgi:hypothetical protein
MLLASTVNVAVPAGLSFTSQRLSRVFQQQSVVLAAVSVFLFICAFLLTVGLVLSGYLLIRAIGFLI